MGKYIKSQIGVIISLLYYRKLIFLNFYDILFIEGDKMDFWLYWITIALGSAIGVAVFWIVWWFFLGGKEDEMKF